MTRGIGGRSPANLQKYLKGADYPASKDDLMDLANDNGAPDEIMDILDQMPDVDFESPADVQECYGEIEHGMDFEEEEEPPRREQPRAQERSNESRSRSGAASERHVSQEEIDHFRKRYEDRKRRRQLAQQRDDDAWDRRLKGHETKAIDDARHMRHGYDTRGAVKDPDHDHRLAGNETAAIHDARRMEHGYDGRGRVRKFGPGDTDESIADDRERYEARKAHEEAVETGREPVDPETGSHSRRRKDDAGRTVRGGRETWQQRYHREGRGEQRASQEREDGGNGRRTWREYAQSGNE